MGDMRSTYKVLVGKAERKTPSGRPEFRRKGIKMDLKRNIVGVCGMDSFKSFMKEIDDYMLPKHTGVIHIKNWNGCDDTINYIKFQHFIISCTLPYGKPQVV
jgi:hypothetical protein